MPYKIVRVGNYWKIYKPYEKKFAKPRYKTSEAAKNQAKNWIRYEQRNPFKIKKVGGYWRIYKPIKKQLAKPKFKSRTAAQNQANNWIRYARSR